MVSTDRDLYRYERRRVGNFLRHLNDKGYSYYGARLTIDMVLGSIPTTPGELAESIQLAQSLRTQQDVLDLLNEGIVNIASIDAPTNIADVMPQPIYENKPELHSSVGFNSYMEFASELQPENFSNLLVYETLRDIINTAKDYTTLTGIGNAIFDLRDAGYEISDIEGYQDYSSYLEFFFHLIRNIDVPDEIKEEMNIKLTGIVEQFSMDWASIERKADRSKEKAFRRAFGVKDWG